MLNAEKMSSKEEVQTTTTTTTTPTAAAKTAVFESVNGDGGITLSDDPSLSLVEKIYDLVRRNEDPDKIGEYLETLEPKASLQVNEILKNGDTLLCLCCSKNLKDLVRLLVEMFSVDLNLCRSLNVNTASFSSVTPTVTISARRQSRLISSQNSLMTTKNGLPKGSCFIYFKVFIN